MKCAVWAIFSLILMFSSASWAHKAIEPEATYLICENLIGGDDLTVDLTAEPTARCPDGYHVWEAFAFPLEAGAPPVTSFSETATQEIEADRAQPAQK